MTVLADDLEKLRTLKANAAAKKKEWQKAKDEADQWELSCFDRMDAERTSSQKVDGVNFVRYETTYAQVQDRSEFVKWALENEPELVHQTERGELINQKVRQLLDDGQPLPPGLGYRVDQKVGVRGAEENKRTPAAEAND